MKKAVNLMLAVMLAAAVFAPFSALGEDAPAELATPLLTEISFKNATIDGEFSPLKKEYTITLQDTTQTPTLKSYSIDGEAELFVTYSLDMTNHQTGIVATLEFEGGTNIYNFAYSNAKNDSDSPNNLLSELTVKGGLGEVYPAINEKDTEYSLYIPSDMTVLNLTAVTQDVNAGCACTKEFTLKPDQKLEFEATVTAANGDTRVYTFKVKRLDKTTEEVKAEIADPNFETLVKGELFYQKPVFMITVCAAAGGLLLLILFIRLAKRLMVKAGDPEEQGFFEESEEEEEQEEEKTEEE